MLSDDWYENGLMQITRTHSGVIGTGLATAKMLSCIEGRGFAPLNDRSSTSKLAY